MEEDEALRTIECLRGRLLAERAVTKAANDESEQINKKVTELEKQLKMEIKSRNKAEKRLKILMKKLDSLNILYVSADESSCISAKSEISSVSSSKSQHDHMEVQKAQISNISKSVMNTDACGERHDCPSHDGDLRPLDEGISENSNDTVIQSSKQDGDECDLEREDNNGSKSFVTHDNNDDDKHLEDIYHNVHDSIPSTMVEDRSTSASHNDDDDEDDMYDNSMALVAVNYVVNEEKKDVSISNGNVKDVLDALRYARECLQTSMDVRHMKSNIAHPRLDKISC